MIQHIPNSLKGMHKNFDGKRYVAWGITSTKQGAEEMAEGYRADGYLARYTESKIHKGYLIWARRR